LPRRARSRRNRPAPQPVREWLPRRCFASHHESPLPHHHRLHRYMQP
jgi:hypothetical protein